MTRGVFSILRRIGRDAVALPSSPAAQAVSPQPSSESSSAVHERAESLYESILKSQALQHAKAAEDLEKAARYLANAGKGTQANIIKLAAMRVKREAQEWA